MASRTISSRPIKFGRSFEPERMKELETHLNRMTSELQRIMQMLSDGVAGQVLTKISPADYDATWTEGGGAGTLIGAENLGTAVPLFKAIADGVLQFRTIRGSGLLEADYTDTEVVLDVTITAEDVPYEPVSPLTAENVQDALDQLAAIVAAGGGIVLSVVGTTDQIDVDSSDPANPVLSLSDSVLADLDLAASAVQPDDLSIVAFTGIYDDMVAAPPYRIEQSVDDETYTISQFKKGRSIIAVQFSGPAFVRLPHDLPTDRLVSVKDEAGSGDITIVSY